MQKPLTPFEIIKKGISGIVNEGKQALIPKTNEQLGIKDQSGLGIARNTVMGIPNVVKNVVSKGKEFVIPSRGFSEQQISEAKPNLRDQLVGISRSASEIAQAPGAIGSSILEKVYGVKPYTFGQKTLEEYSKPTTPEEAKAMRLVDIAGFAPIGSVKNLGKTAEVISKLDDALKIEKELKGAGFTDNIAKELSPKLVNVTDPVEVSRIMTEANKYVKSTPTQYFHGTRAKDLSDTSRPIFLTQNKDFAKSYSNAVGAGRKEPFKLTGLNFDGDVYSLNSAKDKFISANGNEIDFSSGRRLIERNEAEPISEGAKVFDVNLKNKNVLDLTKKDNTLNILNKSIDEILETNKSLTPEQIRQLKVMKLQNQNYGFDWGLTNREFENNLWKDVISPKLSEKGYGGIKFADDGDLTTMAFPKSWEIKKTLPITEADSIEKMAKEIPQSTLEREILTPEETFKTDIADVVTKKQTPIKDRVGFFDYLKTPENVLKKIGLEKESKLLRTQYEAYSKELPQNLDKITAWSKRVTPEGNERIYKWLDGQKIDLNSEEKTVAGEIKNWLSEWADRLNLPEEDRVTNYITRLFEDQIIKKEFDEDLAKIITDKIPGEVYDPFLQKRLGAKGYKQDTWAALEAYVKRATRKVNLDPALQEFKNISSKLEKSQWDYLKKYLDIVNMRPSGLDNLIDNSIKQSAVQYRLGARPTALISRVLRQNAFRGMIGANIGSAIRNLTQGVNTYAKLGEKYTAVGYIDLLKKGTKELEEVGVLADNFIQDRTLSATKKAIQKLDKALFFLFDTAEKINRGSAYYGAKAKALSKGMSETEAIEFAKKLVRETQFNYGKIDIPVSPVLSSDIGKIFFQFMTYPVKQTEFLTGLAKNKEYMAIARYILGSMGLTYTIGSLFGFKPTDFIPFYGQVTGQQTLGVPPSLKAPVEIAKAVVNAPDKYGKPRDLEKKMSDIGKTLYGVIPGGIQLKKTIEGTKTVSEGGSYDKGGRLQFEAGQNPVNSVQNILLGKYSTSESQKFFKEGGISKAEILWKRIKDLPREDKIANLKRLEKENPSLAREVKTVISDENLKTTDKEKEVRNMGVENFERSSHIYTEVKKLKTKEEKVSYLKNLEQKKILTDKVSEQLKKMLSGKLKPLTEKEIKQNAIKSFKVTQTLPKGTINIK